ncbi:MAG: hypothetical protein ACP5DZ_05115, partial [Bacteroidales bacterium]
SMNNPRSSHTHCQATPANTKTKAWQRVCLSNRTDEKETTKAQHCIKAIAGEVAKSRSLHLINLCGGRQVIALKSATALILARLAG